MGLAPKDLELRSSMTCVSIARVRAGLRRATAGLLFKPGTKRMNEKLPAPCEACRGTGMRHGALCGECQGKGYRLFVNGNQVPVRQERPPQRWQGKRPAPRQR